MISTNIFAAWLGLFIALVFNFYFIVSSGNADSKRKWFGYLTTGVSLLFIAVAIFTLGSRGIFLCLLLIPAVLLSCFVLIKTTKFCDGCGSGAPFYASFRGVQCCQKCKKQFVRSKA